MDTSHVSGRRTTEVEQFAELTRMSSEHSCIFISAKATNSSTSTLNEGASQIHLSSGAWEHHSADTENRHLVGQCFRRCEADPCALWEAYEFMLA
jgi:hypothetical protein